MESIKELRELCQKSKKAPQPFFRAKMWRVVSIYITRILLHTNITANQITFITIILGFIAAFFFVFGNYWCSLTGALLLEFSYLLDAVDGEIARYRKTSSIKGVFLDLIAHITNITLPLVGITIGLYTLMPNLEIVILGLSASVFSLCTLDIQPLKHQAVFTELKKHREKFSILKKYFKIKNKEIKKEDNIFKKIFNKVINPFYDHLLIMHIILFAVIFNKLYCVLIFYGLTFPIVWLVKVIYEYKIGT